MRRKALSFFLAFCMMLSLLPTSALALGEETMVATPVADPASGEVVSDTTVALSSTTDGAKIYYTTNGTTTPSATDGTEYTAPITVDQAMTIQAIAVRW